MDPWKQRERSLRSLGFESYGEYLDSDLWAKIRRHRWAMKDTVECHFCGAKPDQLHHDSYNLGVMEGEKLHHLVPVCGECHKCGSVDEEGRCLRPREASAKMKARAKRLGLKPKGLRAPPREERHRRRSGKNWRSVRRFKREFSHETKGINIGSAIANMKPAVLPKPGTKKRADIERKEAGRLRKEAVETLRRVESRQSRR